MPVRPTSLVHGGRPPRFRARRPMLALAACLAVATTLVGAQGPAPPQAAPTPAAGKPKTAAQKLPLETSDGVKVFAWYYPAARPEPEADAKDADEQEAVPTAVVILLHDLGGSHQSVEPLAKSLQSRGIAVVAPDLRGHGETTGPEGRGDLDPKSLKQQDFNRMVVTSGGQVRDQATVRGDVEAVRSWIWQNAARHALDTDRLFVVGSGVGAAVAAHWTANDARWPDLAIGPQGRQVRGLVLVSPAWTTRGFSISPALAAEPLKQGLPILVVAGSRDADAVKLYDQLKKWRPDQWSEKRTGQPAATQSPRLAQGARPTVFLRQFDSPLSADRLAADVPRDGRAGQAATVIEGFIAAITAVEE